MVQLIITAAPLRAAEKAREQFPLLKINKELDKRTEIKKSLIPNAGNGLYARVPIKKGEVIGELGGGCCPPTNIPKAIIISPRSWSAP